MTILMVFFGGFQSDQIAMDLWLASARKQKKDIHFEGFPFPNIRKSDDEHAVNGFKQFGAAIKIIEDSHADKIFIVFIVGHSSGCAIANEVNLRLGGTTRMSRWWTSTGLHPNPNKSRSQRFKPGLLWDLAVRVNQ